MLNVQVVQPERHVGLRWQRFGSYEHAAADAVAHLVLPEISRACVAMPIGFIMAREKLVPVAVQGLEPGRNLFVAEDGRWLGGYIPAAYRSHPFALGSTREGQPILCVLEDSDLLGKSGGEPFYDEHGQQAPCLKQVLEFMIEVSRQRQATQRVCAALQKHSLIEPWIFKSATDAGERHVEGLYRVDKVALKALSARGFEELRLAGALPVIYCQLLSMQHLPNLHRMAQDGRSGIQARPPAIDGDLDLEFLSSGETVSFGLHASMPNTPA